MEIGFALIAVFVLGILFGVGLLYCIQAVASGQHFVPSSTSHPTTAKRGLFRRALRAVLPKRGGTESFQYARRMTQSQFEEAAEQAKLEEMRERGVML